MNFSRCVLTIMVLGGGIVSYADAVDDFFRSRTPDSYGKLSEQKVFPQGRKFPFSFYSTGGGSEKSRGELLPAKIRETDQKEIIGGGVTMIGPQYELNEMSLETAKKYHVAQIYSIYPKIMVNGRSRLVDRAYFQEMHSGKQIYDEEKLREAIAREVRMVRNCPEIAWWDIVPEELRYWRKYEKRYLQLAFETIRANDPRKRPVFMYEPGHRDAAALEEMLAWQDLSVKGTYVNYSGHKKERVWVRYSIEQQAEAVRKMAEKDSSRKLYPIALTEMFQEPLKEEYALIPDWVSHDVYASLIAGARGVLVFSASRRPDFKARKTYLNAYLKVCAQLTGKMNLGQIFLFGEKKKDMTCSMIQGPETVSCQMSRKKVEYPPVAFAVYGWQGKRYAVLVNSADEEVRAVVEGMPYSSRIAVRNLLRSEGEFIAPEGEFQVSLAPLQAAVYEIFCKN